jgi:two-component sensor histidine kinase
VTQTPHAEKTSDELQELAATSELAEALASDSFKQILDHVPVAIVVGELGEGGDERIVYANHEAELIIGQAFAEIEGSAWASLDDRLIGAGESVFSHIVRQDDPAPGSSFLTQAEDTVPPRRVELETAMAVDEEGDARFRLVALIDVTERDATQRQMFEAQIREKDVLLQEIQHRVKNNLQIVMALIRMEARRAGSQIGTGPFERLGGRIEALGLLYRQLEFDDKTAAVDLGSLISQIAGSVIKAQGADGIRLDVQVEPCATGINTAMPIALLVNELITNAMKYAFEGRTEGVVTVRCLKDGEDECVVSVADDGPGMADGAVWPQPGKLGALMVRSIEDNAKATVELGSSPEGGVATTIRFRLAPRPAPAA